MLCTYPIYLIISYSYLCIKTRWNYSTIYVNNILITIKASKNGKSTLNLSFCSYFLEGRQQVVSSLHRAIPFNFNPWITRQPKMHRLTSKADKLSRLLRLTPLLSVITGSVLILLGNTAAIKGCKMAGPVVVAVGGLLLLFIAVWSSRQDKFVENTNCEEAVIAAEHDYANRTTSSDSSNDQLGPIHHFEIKTSSESQSWREMVPPPYEEAVEDNDNLGNSQTSAEVVPSGSKESNLDNTTSNSAPPPSYEESHENAKTAS